jgi:thimet oligopeptidase
MRAVPGPERPEPGKEPPGEQARPRPEPLAEGVLREPDLWLTKEAVEKGCEQRIKAAQALLEQILATKGPRTPKSTLEPFNRLLTELDRTLPLAELIANVHPEKEVRSAAEACEQRAKKWLSELKLNRPMFEAIQAVDPKGLDAADSRFQRLLLRDYRRAGVDRDQPTREKLAKLDAQMVKLGQEFSRNIREDKRFLEVTEKELEGMPEDFLKARRKAPGARIRLSTDTTDFFPVQSYARSEAVRRGLYMKYLARAYPANERVLKALLQARHAYATTLGYPDWAQYAAEDKMVKEKKVIEDFIERVTALARPKMEADLKELLARKQKDIPAARQVGKWDRFYYVKKLQAERFGVKPDEVRAYFDFGKVKAGLLRIGGQLAGVTFQHVPGAKVWHPQVEAWDMLDQGVPRARLYLDLHPREGKYGHAALFPITSGLTGVQLPSAALVTNFPDPSKSAGGPALMEHNQVTTFFHEFGHLLHHLMAGRHRWVTQSGINCEWDFVEAPSQLMEEWAWDPAVLATFAVHHQTGERIPSELVRKMRAAEELGKGVHVMRQMYYAALSFQYHARDPKGLDLLGLQKELQKKYSPFPWEPGTTTYASFGHLQGYGSMYYTYMWSLVLSKDLFTRFQKSGLMQPDTALAYRREILEPGGARDAEELVKAFLGRPYTFDAYQNWLTR